MTLNEINGELTLTEFAIGRDTLRNDFLTTISQRLEYTLSNPPRNSYFINNIDKGELACSFEFFNEKLRTINISLGANYSFPPFEITKEEVETLKNKLYLLGGEKRYLWGEVIFFQDTKGGVASIIVKYY